MCDFVSCVVQPPKKEKKTLMYISILNTKLVKLIYTFNARPLTIYKLNVKTYLPSL